MLNLGNTSYLRCLALRAKSVQRILMSFIGLRIRQKNKGHQILLHEGVPFDTRRVEAMESSLKLGLGPNPLAADKEQQFGSTSKYKSHDDSMNCGYYVGKHKR